MTTVELAKDFTNILKKNDHEGAASKYNSDDIVSYEAMDGPMAVCRGKDAVKAKGDWWQANHEVHGSSVEGPYVNGDQFVVRFTMDVTPKATSDHRRSWHLYCREWKDRRGALLLSGGPTRHSLS